MAEMVIVMRWTFGRNGNWCDRWERNETGCEGGNGRVVLEREGKKTTRTSVDISHTPT